MSSKRDSGTTLRTTAILKTDICGFTPALRKLSHSRLSAYLDQHSRLIEEVVAENGGTIIKGEGDAFWISFPSVTAAAVAAVEMQRELRHEQAGGHEDDHVAIRAMIAVGDVLHKSNDVFGQCVNLVARMEPITPPGEVYLSHAARLALNHTDIQTSPVDVFRFQGFPEPQQIFRVDHTPRVHVEEHQVLAFTDLTGFSPYADSHSLLEVETLLNSLDEAITQVCSDNDGTVRTVLGDGYFLSFTDAAQALSALAGLAQIWTVLRRRENVSCGFRAGIHMGTLNLYRSFAFSADVNDAARLEALMYKGRSDISVLVSRDVCEAVAGTEWGDRLRELDPALVPKDLRGVGVFELQV